MQALMALIGVDHSLGMNCLHHAFLGASHAGITALLVALQPLEHPQSTGDGERRTQRTQITAVETFNK